MSNARGNVTVRLLAEHDAPAYRELRLQALSQNPEFFLTTYDEYVTRSVESIASRLAPKESDFTLGAFEEKGRLVGSVTLVRNMHPKTRHTAEVVAMFVRPEYRRGHIAKNLLTNLITRATSNMNGVEQLKLAVISDNTPAVQLYERMGFCPFGKEPHAIKFQDRYWDELHMVLTLDRGTESTSPAS